MELSINFIIKIIIIFIIIFAITIILYIKFSSDFFSEPSTNNTEPIETNPYVIDENFLKDLEYQNIFDNKLEDINNSFKELNKEIINYKLKLNNIDNNLELLMKEKFSIQEITTNEALDMIQ